MADLPLEEWRLPPRERAKLYRARADEAESAGLRAPASDRSSYQLIAQQWRRLADDLHPDSK